MSRFSGCLTVFYVLLALAGCNSSSSGNDDTREPEPEVFPDLTLSATSHELSVRLTWSGTDRADVYFARDPECDWDAYGSCAGGGLITDATGDELTLAVEEGLASSRAHWFVLRTEDGRESEMVTGTPWRAVPNDDVFALELADDTLYLGGRFEYLGAPLAGMAVFNSAGQLTGPMPWADDEVLGVTPAPDGSLFLHGEFELVNGQDRPFVARLDGFGRLSNWRVPVNDVVNAVAVDDHRVFLGGDFTQLDGDSSVEFLAAVALEDGSLDTTWTVSMDDEVLALALVDGVLFVGGNFSTVNGESRENLVALDAETGEILSSWQGYTNERVRDILVADSRVFVGGRFSEANGESRAKVAAFDQVSGDLLADWNADLNNDVDALVHFGDRIYAAGRFTEVEDQEQRYVAALDAATGDFVASWRPEVTQRVNALAVHDERLYLGLDRAIDGDYMLVVDLETGDRLETWQPVLDSDVQHISVYQDQILIAGDFRTGLGLSGTGYLAAMEKDTGRVREGWSGSTFDDSGTNILSLAVAGDRLFVGGSFSSVNGQPRSHLAQFNRHSGELDTAWAPSANSNVNAMKIDGDRLYIGGFFDEIDAEARTRAAALSLDSGELVADWAPDLDGIVRAIEVSDGFVSLGGLFATAESADRGGLAVYTTSGDFVEAFPDYDLHRVYALQSHEGALYLGGTFVSASGFERFRTAAIDLASTQVRPWHARIEPDSETPNVFRHVRTLAIDPHAVYVGGNFNYERMGQSLSYLAGFNRLSGEPLDWDPGIEDRPVRAVLADEGRVYVAGWFEQVPGHPARYLVVLEGAGSGPDAEVVW